MPHCGSDITIPMVDLGSAPPSNAYLTQQSLRSPEKWFPLRVLVCDQCWLVQTEDFAQAEELFDAEYAYFSGFSTSWLSHSERYVTDMVSRFSLTATSHVVEVAANDGYLLQYVKACGIPCTGVEPTASTANAARAKGISIVEDFFGVRLATELAEQGKQADLTAANNVLAHVPDINDLPPVLRGYSSHTVLPPLNFHTCSDLQRRINLTPSITSISLTFLLQLSGASLQPTG